MTLQEKNIRKKIKTMKDLPFDNIVLKKFREKDEYFNPKKYLGETRKFFNDGR